MNKDNEQEKPINKSQSRVCMTLTTSSGTWLNDCLQPQHMYVSLSIDDPEGKALVRVCLSYEQAARMLLYNGDVPCTLERYRNIEGELVAEKVEPPESVHQRMKARLGDTQKDLLKRIEDAEKDVYDMINGNIKPGKKSLSELMNDINTIKSHFVSNQSFVVQQAEEELGKMQNNAAGQLGTFLQSKIGIQAPEEILNAMLPTGVPTKLLGEPIKPVVDDYEPKIRPEKSVEDMTAMEVADKIDKYLSIWETRVKPNKKGYSELYCAHAIDTGNRVTIKYISFQGASTIPLEDAKKYLEYFMSNPKTFERHYNFEESSNKKVG